MPPKAKLAAPIDRPLSRAYVREFTGWSTAEPPGVSDPTSLRVMENVMVNRDGSCRVRPGLRYLSYSQAPNAKYVPEPLAADPVKVASNGADSGTSLALGAGTAIGDLLLLGLYGTTSHVCTDPRMTLVYTRGNFSVYIGHADTLDPIIANWGGGWDTGLVTSYRGVGGVRLEYDLNQVASVGPFANNTTSMLPGLPSTTLHGAVCAYLATDGIGGAYGDQSWARSAPWGWLTGQDNSYTEIDMALNVTVPIEPALTPNIDTSSDSWEAVVIGVRVGPDPDDPINGTLETGLGSERPLVGTHEPFYLADGTKAYLQAVREEDDTVGFRVLVVDVNDSTMYTLEDPIVDFEVRQPYEVLNFSAGTTYVKYLQIDNQIFALSDNGEPMRVFSVGAAKEAKALAAITRPEWEAEDKLDVVHPDADWINAGEPAGTRRNRIKNPSFEESLQFWNKGPTTLWHRPADPAVPPFSGSRVLKLESAPERTNLATQPLHAVAGTGIVGWDAIPSWIGSGGAQVEAAPTVTADGTYLKVTTPAKKGTFWARSRICHGVEGHEHYRVAYDSDEGAHVNPKCRLRFLGVNGAQVGSDVELDVADGTGRWISEKVRAPKGAVSVRVYIGGHNTEADATWVKAKNLVVCKAGEGTAAFHGGSGADYFWTDGANNSSSVYHPPASVEISTELMPARPGKAHSASLYMRADTTVRTGTLSLRTYNKHGELLASVPTSLADAAGVWTRIDAGDAAIGANATQAAVHLTFPNVARGEYHYVDAAMFEASTAVADTYFDGSTTDVPTAQHSWKGKRHASVSVREEFTVGATIPPAETRTADTLLSNGGRTVNTFSFGFFYTFDNEVGESAASKITVKRAQRAWADWAWETPNAAGEPSGTDTNKPERAADQLVAIMPEDVYDEALAQGATSWSLYMFTWSDQDAAPVVALKVGEKALPPDGLYDQYGWIRVTPQMVDATDDAPLPTLANRYNYSDPSRGGQGAVVADRMVLVNDPTDAAVIRWTSNRLGEYTNFTASKGGGYKTLTSGNLFVPAAVKLWQNPQSADTICILCLGTDGYSTSYYMAPAQVASQSEAVNFMGFEETTATPGTTSPYGVEVFNNSLYHPLDDQLMKSTASNYNINHKSQTDLIRNMWEKLANKYWIISAVHDSRLYYLVTNPDGDEVEEGCKGNEIWVFDAQAKNGTWSRFKIQAHSLRTIEFGGRIYMSVTRPDGIYYLDPEYNLDNVVDDELVVGTQAISWKLETNTQGANRAHDAWCHLQQLSVSLGYFQGRMRYGLRSVDINGKAVDLSKIVRDTNLPTQLAFDIEDQLRVARDLKEWFFYAESITDDDGVVEPSFGQVSLVQYRYAPISVNVGYEHGSIETFEYGRDAAVATSTTTDNGIPLPLLDSRRP